MAKIDLEHPRTAAEKCLTPIPRLGSLIAKTCLVKAAWQKPQ